jgi:DNA-binding IclR family transcriptional regulator
VNLEKVDLLENEKSRAPAVARAATVLRLLARERSGLGVTEIARRVGLVPSTCFHVLRALVDEGFVNFDAEKKVYRTGVGLLTLVRDALASSEYPKVVQPALDAIAESHRVTTVATELDSRNRMVVVALARAANFISLHVNVGSRFPSLISATGRCVAASSGLSKSELKESFDELKWEKRPRFEDWYSDVLRAQDEGYAIDRGNYIKAITVIATVLPPSPDRAVRGIAVVGFDHLMTEKLLSSLRGELLAAARNVAAQLQ